MKKLLGISLVAVLAVSPLMAHADTAPSTTIGANTTEAGLASNDTGVIIAGKGMYYAGKTISDNDKAATASAAYVKGAYNDAIAAVNKVAADAASATASGITSAVQALDATESQTAGADGLALSITEVDGVITGISGSIAAGTYATAAQGAKADTAVQSVATGDAQSGNGTIKVDGNAVSVYGLGSAAYTDSTAYDAAGAAAAAQTAAITAAAADATSKANAAQAAAEATAAADATTKANAAEQNAKDYADTAITNLNIGDYATKAGVLATVEAATVTADVPSVSVSGTVPMMIEWGAITAQTAAVSGSTAAGSISNGQVAAPATYQQGAL